VTLIPLTVTELVPELESVMICDVLAVPTLCWAKLSAVGEICSVGAIAIAESEMDCGLGAALSMKFTAALLEPLVCGAKSISTIQVELIATVPPLVGQVVFEKLIAKLAASGPVNVICESVKAALPRFLSVIGWGPLVVPIARVPNVRDAGETFAIGAATTPVPVSATTCLAPVSPPELSITSISA
jgi:hypothetical protein